MPHQASDEGEVDGLGYESEVVVPRNPLLEGEVVEPLALKVLPAHHDHSPSQVIRASYGPSCTSLATAPMAATVTSIPGRAHECTPPISSMQGTGAPFGAQATILRRGLDPRPPRPQPLAGRCLASKLAPRRDALTGRTEQEAPTNGRSPQLRTSPRAPRREMRGSSHWV